MRSLRGEPLRVSVRTSAGTDAGFGPRSLRNRRRAPHTTIATAPSVAKTRIVVLTNRSRTVAACR